MEQKLSTPFTQSDLMPQTEMLEVKKRKGKLVIGVPKETSYQENRVCLTPDDVASLTANGQHIVIETGAGEGARFSDKNYSDVGAKIAYDKKQVFECSLVLKVEPPTLLEIELMKTQSVLFSLLPLKTQTIEYIEALSKKKITALAYDYIRDDQGSLPVVKSLGEISGVASIHIASELMSKVSGGKGLLLGNINGVKPTEVVIFGAGTVGEYAAKTAMSFGAYVKVFDNSVSKLRTLQNNIGQPVFTATLQPKLIQKSLKRCDVAIGTLRGITRAPIVVTDDMVQQMKDKSVIIDLSISSGGCFETSEVTNHKKPTFMKYDVIHYCVPNISSRYARTASISISNTVAPMLTHIAEQGGVGQVLRFEKGMRAGLYLYNGILTHKTVADWFDMPYRDINLLFL